DIGTDVRISTYPNIESAFHPESMSMVRLDEKIYLVFLRSATTPMTARRRHPFPSPKIYIFGYGYPEKRVESPRSDRKSVRGFTSAATGCKTHTPGGLRLFFLRGEERVGQCRWG